MKHILVSPLSWGLGHATRDLPIIMISSRAGTKHRDHALALGVNRFLSKPYQESELLDEISSLLTEQHT